MSTTIQHIFLIGAKSIGAYGGYETFINKLTEYHQNEKRFKYHIACKANGDGCMDPYKTEGTQMLSDSEFIYHNAHCFRVGIPEKLGPAQAVYYDVVALEQCCKIIERDNIRHAIVYIMACRIGPFIRKYYKKIHSLGGKVYLNPDGHEWMREKWNFLIKKYWKISEKMMIKHSDLVICDSLTIENYIHQCYDGKGLNGANPKTTFIAYGAETRKSLLTDSDDEFTGWLRGHELYVNRYYLVVGRFVPENNYEIMIREFMKSNSEKDFAIITNVNDKFLNELERKLHYRSDHRIKFVGTVYDQELLMKIRENAYGYLHGHEVGGTNPSLLEALGCTKLNLLLDVGFNREVAEDAAVYWNKEEGNLSELIDKIDLLKKEMIGEMGRKAKERIAGTYSWEHIANEYRKVFLKD